ncbi:hypothetical protein [Streptomyces rimosus]|uniref:hypothetical protein n=1 Tax=Streptomyces rimosus TaxID=1927 RepID=UPI0004C59908|nr:hypothetical protein [Streptomyces rimosus]
MHDRDAVNPVCTICMRGLRDDEWDRLACRICQDRGTAMLSALPGLYDQLGDLLEPGPGRGDGRVSGTRGAPLPCSLHVLDLRARGGLVTVLADWEAAVRDELGYTAAVFRGDLRQTLAGVVSFLTANAPWVYASFPAVADLHRELRALHSHAARMVTGEQAERKVRVLCGCGATLPFTVSTPGEKCRTCGTQYGHADLFDLPLADRAERSAA